MSYGWGISGCCKHAPANPQFVTIRSLNGIGQELWHGDDGVNPPAAVLLDQNGDVVTLHPGASVIKWSKSGTQLWKNVVGNFSSARCMAIDGSNNIYVGGDNSPTRQNQRTLTKLDPNGNILWTQNYLNPPGTIMWVGFQGSTLISLDFDSGDSLAITQYANDPSTVSSSAAVSLPVGGIIKTGYQGSGTGIAAVQGSGLIVIGGAGSSVAQATVTISSFWDGGTFTVSVNGVPTAPITWSLDSTTTAANIQAAIAALPFVASCGVALITEQANSSNEAARIIVGRPTATVLLQLSGSFASSFGSTPNFVLSSFVGSGIQGFFPSGNTDFVFNDEISSGEFTITATTTHGTYVSSSVTYSSDASVLGPAIQSAMNAMGIVSSGAPPGTPPISFNFDTSWTTGATLNASPIISFGNFLFSISITPKTGLSITSLSIANNSVRTVINLLGQHVPLVSSFNSSGFGGWNFAKIDIASGSTQWLQNTNDGQSLSCVYVSPANNQIILGASGPNVVGQTVYVYDSSGSPPNLLWSESPQVTTNHVTSASTVSVAADNQGNFYSASGGAAFGFSSGGSELWTNHQGSVGFVICEQSVAPFYTQARAVD